MAQQIGQIIRQESPQTASPASSAMSQLVAMMDTEIVSREQCEKLRALALAAPSGFVPATPEEIAKQLEFIAAALPSKNVDESAGQKRFAVYVRILGGYSKQALAYMTERACRELNWFPTPKQCLDILNDYRATETPRDKVLRKCSDFVEKQFAEFKAELASGTVEQALINEKPERWLRIAEEQGFLRWDGKRFIQRLPKPQARIELDDAA